MTSNKKELRIGLIGFGSMGKTHAYAVHNFPFYYSPMPYRASIVGVCTTSYERSQAIAAEYGFDRAYRDAQEMIADDRIDVIDICTPNELHFDTVIAALRAGKYVYCEKPLCINEQQAMEIARCERESAVFGGMVFNNRFMAPMLRAKQLIDQGRLGRILSFHVAYEHNSSTFSDRY